MKVYPQSGVSVLTVTWLPFLERRFDGISVAYAAPCAPQVATEMVEVADGSVKVAETPVRDSKT